MAATQLLDKKSKLRRFGFITTNSITQTFSRRVIENHMAAKTPLSLVYAIPDHPWMKASDKAAVRIAMTVVEKGDKQGILAKVISEAELNTDTPQVGLESEEGKITAKFKCGVNPYRTQSLMANNVISSRGVSLHGAGFIITPQQAAAFGLGKVKGLENHIREYRNGRDITDRPRGVMVLDFYPLSKDEVLKKYPVAYQHISENVKAEREAKIGASADMVEYANKWWLFGKVRKELRPVLEHLSRYIITVETAKHRFFEFLDRNILPDNALWVIGVDKSDILSVLSSRLSVI